MTFVTVQSRRSGILNISEHEHEPASNS